MRLPFVQVDQELLEYTAPEMAVLLDAEEAVIGWGLVRLIPWALGRCPENELPSANDVVRGPAAARLIARAAGWQGDAEAYIDAGAQGSHPIFERVEGGIRVRGLGRYDAALEAAQTRSEKARKAAAARWGNAQPVPAGCSADARSNAQPVPGDAYTHTHTQTDETTVVARASRPAPGPAAPPSTPGLSLRDRLEAAWLEQRGREYAWSIGRDDPAVRELLVLAKGDEDEVLRRWGIALVTSFPRCLGVPSLVKHWDAYATPESAPAASQPARAAPAGARAGRRAGDESRPCASGCGGVARGATWGQWTCASCTEELLGFLGGAPSNERAREWVQRAASVGQPAQALGGAA